MRAISLPCSGKVDVPYLIKAMETGADGVVILTCPEKECRHLEGTARACKRAEAVGSLLEEMGRDRGRVAVIEYEGQDSAKVLAQLQDFLRKVGDLPPLSAPTGATNQKVSPAA